jgi:hypothetical protein
MKLSENIRTLCSFNAQNMSVWHDFCRERERERENIVRIHAEFNQNKFSKYHTPSSFFLKNDCTFYPQITRICTNSKQDNAIKGTLKFEYEKQDDTFTKNNKQSMNLKIEMPMEKKQ